jgi:Protein of unknown function (DUF4199)
MKNTIIKYGLISGSIAAVCMFLMGFYLKSMGSDMSKFENSMYIGYTLILLSMAVIFFAVKSYRDEVSDGKVSFGKGLLIGLGITLISCACYSLMWLVVYYNFMPNFMDDFSRYSMDKLRATGASDAEILKSQTEMNQFKEMYKSPFSIFALTMIEPLPIGILISFVSAFILKKK